MKIISRDNNVSFENCDLRVFTYDPMITISVFCRDLDLDQDIFIEWFINYCRKNNLDIELDSIKTLSDIDNIKEREAREKIEYNRSWLKKYRKETYPEESIRWKKLKMKKKHFNKWLIS